MRYDKEKLVGRIKSKLGGDKITLEISDRAIGDAIEDSLDDYISIFGICLYKTLQVSSSVTKYDLSTSVWSPDDISDIRTMVNDISSNMLYGFGIYKYPGVPYGKITDFAIDFYNLQYLYKDIKNMLGPTISWRYNRIDKQLYLKVVDGIDSVMIEYQKDVTEEERLDLVKLPHFSYFYKLCVAHTKETLGLTRRKYNGVPIPGGELSLDGGELVSEAKDEIASVLEDLRSMLEDFIIKG